MGVTVAPGSDPTFEDWREVIGHALQASRSIGFVIGDLINYAGKRWGEKYKEAQELTGLDYQTLKQYSSVCARVKPYARAYGLSWKHHCRVAPLKEAEQIKWLEICRKRLATDDEIGVRRLGRSIEAGHVVPLEEAYRINENRGIPNHLSQITRLLAWWRHFKENGRMADRSDEQKEAFWADFEPLVTALGEIAKWCGYRLTVEAEHGRQARL